MVVRHAWLGPVDRAYLELAQRVRNEKVQAADQGLAQAVQLVGRELGAPVGATLREYEAGIRFEWATEDVVQASGRIAGDFNPNTAPSSAAE